MPKFVHTIWITTFTLIALVLSSVAAGASGNPEWEKHDEPAQTIVEIFHSTSDICDNQTQPKSKASAKHQCCSSMCVMNLPTPSPLDKLARQSHSLALIGYELQPKTIGLSKALYRPPILFSYNTH
ncbi:hypothetical protein [Vibrio tapetis]|uniref:Uncharacterized protein n=1 Tax=Vibrio tapetis subsp. tapetis TaxID=1671868 RepID=A0A2N8ZIT1_9VIBR|nr:hypothetical protein [Vibrio tapetis]SON51812.1 exported protein of unknown function [Vibrio tapetis subsp. tapetis]